MKTSILGSAAALSMCVTISVQAAGGPGGAGGGGGSRAGGASMDHRSTSGRDNTNAQNLPDSTRGLDRAQQRMSDQGKTHQKATEQEKKQGKTKAEEKKGDKKN